MLSYCASKPKVPGDDNTKKKTNNDQVTELPDTSNNQKTLALEKMETANKDHIEVKFSLKNADNLETYTIFSQWDKEALLEADADIATLDWEDAQQGKSGMKLKLPRDSEEANKAHVYIKVENKDKEVIIKKSYVIDVPALEEEVDEEGELAANALLVLEGDKVLCAAQQDNKAVVISYDTVNNAMLINQSNDYLKTWTVSTTMNDLDLEDAQNCHIGIHEDYVFMISDAVLTTDSLYSNSYIFVGPDHEQQSAGFMTVEDFSLLANQFNIVDVAVVGDRAYIALSNEEQNKLISLYIEQTTYAIFDRDKTRVATLSGISPIESILPEQENIADFYDFTFLTQDQRSYWGNDQTGIDWTVSNDDKVDLIKSNNGSHDKYFVQYKAASKKNTYYEMVTTFDPATYEESYSWVSQEGELTIPLAVETMTKGADNQLILHNESQVFFSAN